MGLVWHRAEPDVRTLIGIVVVMLRGLPTDIRSPRRAAGGEPVRFGPPSPRGRKCLHDDAHQKRHAKRRGLRLSKYARPLLICSLSDTRKYAHPLDSLNTPI